MSRQRIANRASSSSTPRPGTSAFGALVLRQAEDGRRATASSRSTPTARRAEREGRRHAAAGQWNSVRRAEGNGFYTWETERRLIDAGTWTVTSAVDSPCRFDPAASGGAFIVTAHRADGEGRSTTTIANFYALGEGYTAWVRYDHNRIDLVPERATYKPGDTARIMIQSPWERATALVTTEREGIRTPAALRAHVHAADRVRCRSPKRTSRTSSSRCCSSRAGPSADTPDDGSDPGKPSFRLGYVELKVEDAIEAADVARDANREEYRPANRAKVDVTCKDAAGRPASGEVTLWAVDYGVLSLTAFQTPDVLKSVYVPKALQVSTERQPAAHRLAPRARRRRAGTRAVAAEGSAAPARCARTSACSRSGWARR